MIFTKALEVLHDSEIFANPRFQLLPAPCTANLGARAKCSKYIGFAKDIKINHCIYFYCEFINYTHRNDRSEINALVLEIKWNNLMEC